MNTPRTLARRSVAIVIFAAMAALSACQVDASLAPRNRSTSAQRLSPLTALTVRVNGPSKIQVQGTYSWTATVTGATGTITYHWQVSRDMGATWQGVGTNSATYSRLEREDEAFWLHCTATTATQTGTSNPLKVEVVLAGGP
jgi:hypothetical protein